MEKKVSTIKPLKGKDTEHRPAKYDQSSFQENIALKSTWKQTILELSQKEGYTGIAL